MIRSLILLFLVGCTATPNVDWQNDLFKLGKQQTEKMKMIEPGKYVIVRTYTAGVFAGELVKREGREVTLKNARRLWYWEGAASLSQLAQSGTSKPGDCKFPEPVDEVLLLEAIEVLSVTATAQESIARVTIWKA